MDRADPLAWIAAEADDWSSRGLARWLVPRRGTTPGRLAQSGQSLINFGSNNYLGLASDPRVVTAARGSAEAFGWGAGASPLVTGWTEAHDELATALARFEQAEAAVLFPTGYAANLGTIAALVGKDDAIYSDRLNHACLIDGARLSRATVRIYPHNDAGGLEAILTRDKGRFRRGLIVTDGVFSMDGDLAPLAELADLADRFGLALLVDEAHGTGVFGPDGRGAGSECGVADRVHVRVGTLSKAMGSIGGFVAGSRILIDWLINHARPLIYSTALPPAAASAAREALAIAQAEPWRRIRVRALGLRLRQDLIACGFEVSPSDGPIVAVMICDPEQALAVARALREHGLVVPAIRPPTVPTGTARLRITLSAAHADDEVETLVRALRNQLRPKVT